MEQSNLPAQAVKDDTTPGKSADAKKDTAPGYRVFCMYTSQLHMDDVITGLKKGVLYEDEPVFFPRIERIKRIHGRDELVYPAMFPNYLFIESHHPEDLFLRVRAAQGKTLFQYCQLLRNNEYIYPISTEEEERIAALCDEDHVLHSSTGYQEGDRLIVTDGPLKNWSGRIIRINRHKKIAVLSLPFMGENREVLVGLDVVRKLPAKDAPTGGT